MLPASPATARVTRRSLALSAAGVVIEWYDFAIYLYLAPVLGRLFMPSADPRVQLLAAYGLFAAGYLARPLGAVFYGVIGDRLGRKGALITSASLMAACKLVEGLLPTYATAGIAATVLLLVMRLFSGFSMGGEYAGTFVYLVENAPARWRATTISIANTMCALGIFGAALVVSLVSLLGAAAVDAGAWRIPFLAGAAAGVAAILMRTQMQESVLFQAAADEGNTSQRPLAEAVRRVPRAIASTFGLAVWVSVTYHLLIAFVPGYLRTFVGVEPVLVDWIATAASLLTLPLMVVPAYLADLYGRKWVLVVSALAVLALADPLFRLLCGGHPLAGALVAVPLAVSMNATAAALAVELFPTRLRYTGFALGFNLGSVFGGLTPTLGTWLISRTGSLMAPSGVVMAAAAAALVLLATLPETRDRPLE